MENLTDVTTRKQRHSCRCDGYLDPKVAKEEISKCEKPAKPDDTDSEDIRNYIKKAKQWQDRINPFKKLNEATRKLHQATNILLANSLKDSDTKLCLKDTDAKDVLDAFDEVRALLFPNEQAKLPTMEQVLHTRNLLLKSDRILGGNKYPIPQWDFLSILSRMGDIHEKKNSDYNGAADQAYQELGMSYYLAMFYNKIIRLKSLTIDNKSRKVLDESVDDTLLDLANYAVMALESRHKHPSETGPVLD